MLVLPRKFDAPVDEAGGFDKLHETAQSYELGRVHFNLGEARDQTIGELVVTRQQTERQRADRVGRPRLKQREEKLFLGAGVLRLHLAHQDRSQILVLRTGCDHQSQSFDELLLEDEIPVVLQLARELHEDLLTADRIAQFLDHLLDLVVELRL